MPGQNGTGPAGTGPMTGRGLGPCAGGQPAGMRGGMGRGFRRNGNPRGFFRRRGEAAELSALRSDIAALRQAVAELKGGAK